MYEATISRIVHRWLIGSDWLPLRVRVTVGLLLWFLSVSHTAVTLNNFIEKMVNSHRRDFDNISTCYYGGP